MTNVSKKYIEKKLQTEAWSRFLKKVHQSKSAGALLLSIREFLTDSEITMLEKRLSIPILLERKMSYRAIGAAIDVSPATISFVKHNLTKKPVRHRQYSSFSKPRRVKKLLPPYKGAQSII